MIKAIKFVAATITTVASATIVLSADAVYAATITQGFTFSAATNINGSVGTHFHSSTGGEFGNPSGKAEVGDFFAEEVRGLSEYDLTSLGVADSAFVAFDVFLESGLFIGENDFPFDGNIDVFAYAGNNTEDLSDFQAPVLASIGTFNTTDLSVGDVLSFDITSVFNNAISDGLSSLGIRLQIADGTDPNGGALTFDSFRLTTEDESVNTDVPEPTSVLGLLALAALTGTSLKCQRQEDSQ